MCPNMIFLFTLNTAFIKKINWGLILNYFWRLDPRRHFVMNLPKNSKLLDFGCGNCEVLKRFHELRPDIKITGVDIINFSEDMQKCSGDFIQIDKIDDICHLGCESFDAVTCIHVLEHLDISSYPQLMNCFLSILKINGKLYLETPHSKSIYFPSLSFFSTDGGPINFFDYPTHIRPFTEAALNSLLSKHFHIEKIGSYRNLILLMLSPFLLFLGLVSRRLLVLGVHHLFGWSLYSICNKPDGR